MRSRATTAATSIIYSWWWYGFTQTTPLTKHSPSPKVSIPILTPSHALADHSHVRCAGELLTGYNPSFESKWLLTLYGGLSCAVPPILHHFGTDSPRQIFSGPAIGGPTSYRIALFVACVNLVCVLRHQTQAAHRQGYARPRYRAALLSQATR